ncbi:MAG: tRNA pseudouridine(55) synthase TruB [Bdellovibrionales bacterium]|nr:tRNA pseudouridine(55) synthase TruB [Bdellovibrionales bacterium]
MECSHSREPSPNGIVVLNKPSGITSASAVHRLKRSLELSKRYSVGHSGTLDPMATGVLVCLVGKATKLASSFSDASKQYSGRMRFGIRTSTDDIEGEVLETLNAGVAPDFNTILSYTREFQGEILQVPPSVSAIRVNGERAYRRVLRGEDVKIVARKVQVDLFEIFETEDPWEVSFRIQCGSGTYIRSLARDLGERLGVGGCLASLQRDVVGPFSLRESICLEEISPAVGLRHWSDGFLELPEVIIGERHLAALCHGRDAYSPIQGDFGDRTIVRFAREQAFRSEGLLELRDHAWKIRYISPEVRESVMENSGRVHE